MYYFSFKNGTPIATVGGKKLYINEDKDNKIDLDIDEFLHQKLKLDRKLSRDDYKELKKALERESKPSSKKLVPIYKDLIQEAKKRKGREYDRYENDITQYPSDKREVIYVCGKSGSGKSTACAEYIKSFAKRFPDSEIILFSTVREDPALKNINMNIVDLSQLEDDGIEIDELEDDSLIIFDDIDTIQNKKIKQNVVKLMDEILETGRHRNIYCLITNHLINDYKKTRKIINELTKLIIFPCGTSAGNIKYVLERSLGFSPEQSDEVLDLKSRYIIISNQVPQYVLCSNKIFLI